MNGELKQIQCDDKCGFLVRSHDEREVLKIARQHIKEQHNMTPDEADLKARLATVPQTAGSKR
jgi:predicted small metal-binding protein